MLSHFTYFITHQTYYSTRQVIPAGMSSYLIWYPIGHIITCISHYSLSILSYWAYHLTLRILLPTKNVIPLAYHLSSSISSQQVCHYMHILSLNKYITLLGILSHRRYQLIKNVILFDMSFYLTYHSTVHVILSSILSNQVYYSTGHVIL